MALISCSFSSSRLVFQRFLGSSRSLEILARSSSTIVESKDNNVIPFSAMPGVKGTLRNVFGHATGGSFFDVAADRFEKYGPIYREEMLAMKIVNIVDLEAAMKVNELCSKFHMRRGFEFMDDIGDEVNPDAGLPVLSNDYEKWYKFRSLVAPKLMRPKDIRETIPILNDVADDFVMRIEQLSMRQDSIDIYKEELPHWGVEALAACLFNQRLGFYKHPPDSEAVDFVRSSKEMIQDIGKVLHSSSIYKYIKVPAYYSLKRNFLQSIATGRNIINRNLELQHDQSKTETFFEYLAANENVTDDTMTAYLTTLMVGGVDTSSTIAIWLLYLLARNPRVQEKLYEELVSVFGPDGEISKTNIQHLPYIKAILKESNRMFPVGAYILSRAFEKDLNVLGYNIPAGVSIFVHQHLLSVDERYFGKDAKQFVPERWLRDEGGEKKDLNANASLPFGHGVRMCLGRRLAEVMNYTLISKLVFKFRFEYAGGETPVNKTVSGMLMTPDAPVLLKFVPRKDD